MVTLGAKEGAFLLYQTQDVVVNDEDVGVLAESLHLVIDQWIQYELGKQYLWKKVTQPWELNLGPTPIQGEWSIIIVSVFFMKPWSWLYVCLFESLLLDEVVGMTFCKGWFKRVISCIVMTRLQNTNLHNLNWAWKWLAYLLNVVFAAFSCFDFTWQAKSLISWWDILWQFNPEEEGSHPDELALFLPHW